jgi:hypothetical protein
MLFSFRNHFVNGLDASQQPIQVLAAAYFDFVQRFFERV